MDFDQRLSIAPQRVGGIRRHVQESAGPHPHRRRTGDRFADRDPHLAVEDRSELEASVVVGPLTVVTRHHPEAEGVGTRLVRVAEQVDAAVVGFAISSRLKWIGSPGS